MSQMTREDFLEECDRRMRDCDREREKRLDKSAQGKRQIFGYIWTAIVIIAGGLASFVITTQVVLAEHTKDIGANTKAMQELKIRVDAHMDQLRDIVKGAVKEALREEKER